MSAPATARTGGASAPTTARSAASGGYRQGTTRLPPVYDEHGEPNCVLDIEPPASRRWRNADKLLARVHVTCIAEVTLGAINLVAFWATFWWTIAFSALCIVVGSAGALSFRSVYGLRREADGCCCFKATRFVPAVLYGQLAVSVMGLLAMISAILGAVSAEHGSIEYGFAVMSAVASGLLIITSVAAVILIRRAMKAIKPVAAVIVVDGGSADGMTARTAGGVERNEDQLRSPRFAINPIERAHQAAQREPFDDRYPRGTGGGGGGQQQVPPLRLPVQNDAHDPRNQQQQQQQQQQQPAYPAAYGQPYPQQQQQQQQAPHGYRSRPEAGGGPRVVYEDSLDYGQLAAAADALDPAAGRGGAGMGAPARGSDPRDQRPHGPRNRPPAVLGAGGGPYAI